MIVTQPVIHGNDGVWFLTGYLQGKIPVDMLLDTGASFSLLPVSVFEQIPIQNRPFLDPTITCNLTGFTGEKALVKGVSTVKFGTNKYSWEVRFLIVEKCTNCILGVDFMEKHGVRMDYAQGLIWFNQTFSPIHRVVEKSTAAVVKKGHDLLPRSEGVIEAYVECFPPDSVVIVEGTMEDLEHGFVVANTVVTLGEEGKCFVRVMNPGLDSLRIQPCEIGRVSLVSKLSAAHPLL